MGTALSLKERSKEGGGCGGMRRSSHGRSRAGLNRGKNAAGEFSGCETTKNLLLSAGFGRYPAKRIKEILVHCIV